MNRRPPKSARHWYAEHKVNVIPEDWGRRDPATGEGLENAGSAYWGERNRSDRVTKRGLMSELLWFEDNGMLKALWHQRTDEEREFIEALEDFFTPYIALLPKEKASVLDQYLGLRRTQEQIADAAGVSQQAVSKQLRAAVRALVRRIAQDGGLATLPGNDHSITDSERAWFVFDRYWLDRFGRRFNG